MDSLRRHLRVDVPLRRIHRILECPAKYGHSIDMAEYVAPFSKYIEGFAGPNCTDPAVGNSAPLTNLFTNILNVQGTSGNQIALLQDMLEQEKAMADSLMASAKKLSRVSTSIDQTEGAYDAGFEYGTDPDPVPTGATLQGFSLLLLVVSYFVLIVMSAIFVQKSTGEPQKTGIVLIGFLVLGIVTYALLVRLG